MGRLGMPILFFVLRGGDKFSAFVDKGGKHYCRIIRKASHKECCITADL